MDQQTDPTVRHFRQILLWPLELIAAPSDATAAPWELLTEAEPGAVWRIVDDEFPDDPALFQERHYGEFATFLPYAQRLLYGEGPARGVGRVQSPIRVLRRTDVARARLTYPDAAEPVVLDVVHVDLYAFYDVDVVILVVELAGSDLPLRDAQDTLYRLGRAYPTHWTAEGQGGHCVTRAEWLDADGAVLAVSDYEKREKYLAHVGRYRAPAIAAHWEFLLTPLVPHHSGQRGRLRYRPVEYHRMPQLAYLAVDRPRAVSRADFVRLALVTAPGPSSALPFSERHVAEFERRHVDDRYWNEAGEGGSRYVCSGEAMIVFGGAGDRYFADREMGVLAHFRHQQFLLFLIPHFHKAALVLMSDRLVDAVNHLDVSDPESVKRFKRRIRLLRRRSSGSPTATGSTRSPTRPRPRRSTACAASRSTPSGCSPRSARRSRT